VRLKYFLFIVFLFCADRAQAQAANTRAYEVSFEGAAFLPSRIPWVHEILIGIDPRLTIPTSKGQFEVDAFLANGSGTSYSSFSLDYRYDLGNDDFPAFITAGFNGDIWTPPAPNEAQVYGGGWHFGGGFIQPVTPGLSVREDIRYRLGPGTTLIVGLGLNYRFPN
jgi:hypothetical protein